MKCRQIQNLLNSFCDGELKPDQARDVRHHLVHCEECRKEMQSLQRLEHEMLLALSPDPSQDFTANVMGAIRRIPQKKSPFFRRWLPALSYSIIYSAVLFLGLLLNPSGAADSPSASAPPSWIEAFEAEGSMHLSQLQDPYLNSIWSEANERH